MGLLDEAIREHLELKRLRGADPGEIARAERAALEPAFDEQPAEAHDEHQPDHHGDGEMHAHEDVHPDHVAGSEQAVSMGAHADSRAAESRLADFGSPGQETAEIDMRAVLEEDHQAPALDASAQHPPAHQAPVGGSAEDGPEWEMPGREEREGPPEQVPGQERLSFE